MCGIFGLIGNNSTSYPVELINSTIKQLFKLSESRGKEASGLAICSNNTLSVLKQPIPASVLITTNDYKSLLQKTLLSQGGNGKRHLSDQFALLGHSRLVTNGAQGLNSNNQPVVKSGLVGIHNGIIVNDSKLWGQYPSLKREYEVDTEVLFGLIRLFYEERHNLEHALSAAFNVIRGSASTAIFFNDFNCLALGTNTGSLYIYHSTHDHLLLFSSERFILKTLVEKHLDIPLDNNDLFQVKAGQGYIIDLSSLHLQEISLNPDNGQTAPPFRERSSASEIIDAATVGRRHISDLKRCTKCVLPETMPFIEFDESGVCNYCRNYSKIELQGSERLEQVLSKYRSKNGAPDCIVTFSGGRDSSYGLHYIKNVLNMNPIAYTYDWGMVTDLARRNQARICGKLGIEHILVSADINAKRKNIRKNLEAWLKKPDIGMIPLLMAGDKQFFYYANKLRRQTGIKLIIWCSNLLEKTDFKSGFCGIRSQKASEKFYNLSYLNKFKIASYYARQYLSNPAYINSSILDTLFAYFSYYLMPHEEYLFLYQYINWDEDEINSTIINEYDWELAKDTKSTWRIGDGTAAFYNYIYYTVAGFSENETFRSNQIREGMITREQALDFIAEENRPRFESMKEYCNTIGINHEEALRVINSMPRIY